MNKVGIIEVVHKNISIKICTNIDMTLLKILKSFLRDIISHFFPYGYSLVSCEHKMNLKAYCHIIIKDILTNISNNDFPIFTCLWLCLALYLLLSSALVAS